MSQNGIEQLHFEPDRSRQIQEQEEQLLRDFRVYRVGQLCMDAQSIAKAEQLLRAREEAALLARLETELAETFHPELATAV